MTATEPFLPQSDLQEEYMFTRLGISGRPARDQWKGWDDDGLERGQAGFTGGKARHTAVMARQR